jgi:hypothetical protein
MICWICHILLKPFCTHHFLNYTCITYFQFPCNSQTAVLRCSMELQIGTCWYQQQYYCLKYYALIFYRQQNCRIEIRNRDLYDFRFLFVSIILPPIFLLLRCHSAVINNIRNATSSCLQNGNINFWAAGSHNNMNHGIICNFSKLLETYINVCKMLERSISSLFLHKYILNCVATKWNLIWTY